MNLTPQKTNAVMWMGIGMILIMGSGPLAEALKDANSFLLAGAHSLAWVGLILLALGGYRFFRADEKK